MANDCPCKGCSIRSADCHARCEQYSTWKTERNKIGAWLREKNRSPTSARAARIFREKIMRRARGWERKGGNGE